MSRGTSLITLRQMLKAELGVSLTPGVNTADDARYNQLLFNKQIELAGMNDGVFLRDRKDVEVGALGRFYPLPQLNFDRPHTCQNLWNQVWCPMDYGIDEQDYNLINSLLNPPMTVDPVKKWLIVEQVDYEPPVDAPVLANATIGSGLTGVYQYAYTWANPNGETMLSPVGSITANGHPVNGTFDAPVNQFIQDVNVGTTVYATNLYRTKAGASAFFFLTSLAVGTTTFSDSVADAALGVAAPTTNTAQTSYFEVWPVPTTTQTIRFTGERLLNQLVNDTDTADLDDVLLVLSVAAADAARRELQDAPILAKRAAQRFMQLQATQPTSTPVFRVGFQDQRQYRSRKRVLMG